MQPVTTYSNWGYYDQLDGKTLVSGERLSVLWPDGTRTQELTVVQTWIDRGIKDDVGYSEAYVQVFFHGAPATVRLCKSGCLCERIAS